MQVRCEKEGKKGKRKNFRYYVVVNNGTDCEIIECKTLNDAINLDRIVHKDENNMLYGGKVKIHTICSKGYEDLYDDTFVD